MKRSFLLLLLYPLLLEAQFDPELIQKKIESVYTGTIILKDSELICQFLLVGGLPIGVKDQTVDKDYQKYLFDHRDKSVHLFSKKVLINLMKDKSNEIRQFKNKNHFKLKGNHIDEFVALIKYYDSL